jgi:hypothetical protein
MLINISKRQEGKTTKLVELAIKTNSYLVVSTKDEVSYIQHKFQPSPKLITFYEFLQKRYYGKGIRNIIIDDADMLLQQLSNIPIIAISMSTPSEKEQNFVDKIIRKNEPYKNQKKS